MKLLSVDAARRRITRSLSPLGLQRIRLQDGLGRVLGENIRSIDLPLFDNSSVDGFAVRASDLRLASRSVPRRLEVVGDIPAGTHPRLRVGPGEAARVMTGAPIPNGSTAVIMVEDTELGPNGSSARPPEWIHAYRSLARGANIRRRASDVQKGAILLRPGQVLRGQHLGLLAMLGRAQIRVYRRPRVALLSTGNELIPLDRPLPRGGIRDTNSITLGSLIEDAGGDVIPLGVARDDRRALRQLLDKAVAKKADLIVSSAGVSVGALDLVRVVLQEHGQLHFWRVNVRPGKPLAVGQFQGIPFLGLPGNPVSAYVTFLLFVSAAIARLAGRAIRPPRAINVSLLERIELDGRESYLRAYVYERHGSYRARFSGHQGSGNLLSLVRANALLKIPAGVKSLAVGDQVEAWLL